MLVTAKTAALLLALTAALSGCTNELLEPEEWHPPGQNVELNGLKLRYAHIAEAPAGDPHDVGDDVAAYVWLYNETAVTDALVEVSTPAATDVKWVTDGGELATEPFEVPAEAHRALEPLGPHLLLMDLTRQLRAGDFVDVTFGFARAGEVTIPVQVQVPGYENVPP